MGEIKKKWRQYIGPRDERETAERDKIYRKGFIALLLCACAIMGYLLELSYSFGLLEHELEQAGTPLPVDVSSILLMPSCLLSLSITVVCLVIVITLARKGITDSSRFANMNKFPWGYYLLWSFGAGIAFGVGTAGVKALANLQVLGHLAFAGEYYVGYGCGFGIPVAIACLFVFYISFKSALRNRDRIARELMLDDE